MGNDWNSTDSNNEIVLVSIKGRFDKISNQAHWFMAETILTIEQFEGKYILYIWASTGLNNVQHYLKASAFDGL